MHSVHWLGVVLGLVFIAAGLLGKNFGIARWHSDPKDPSYSIPDWAGSIAFVAAGMLLIYFSI